MPEFLVSVDQVNDIDLFNKYKCHHCNHLLKDAVQPICGHWLCELCAKELLSTESPVCPRPDCGDSLKDEGEEAEFFPDNFVRREIKNFILFCRWKKQGCKWEGKFSNYRKHLDQCTYALRECTLCGETLSLGHTCSTRCPLVDIGCKESFSDLTDHIAECSPEHLRLIVDAIKSLKLQNAESHSQDRSITYRSLPDGRTENPDPGYDSGIYPSSKRKLQLVQADHATTILSKGRQGDDDIQKDGYHSLLAQKKGFSAHVGSVSAREPVNFYGGMSFDSISDEVLSKVMSKFNYRDELKKKDDEIAGLKSSLSKLEKLVKSKHAEFEDRDFRLSLIENSNYDGSMVWKIPQFSQRMNDAQSGKYTSIFSLPFYTSRYGYKMCLRLYILGDGIGKGSYMSLFFVVMRGEFDNILRWPFIHKVTFKLINQANNRDVVDTFQPDPMSSSFRKPKSDMNIASGCPRFVSHTDLKDNGFIVDDTVFIKCMVDTQEIHHP